MPVNSVVSSVTALEQSSEVIARRGGNYSHDYVRLSSGVRIAVDEISIALAVGYQSGSVGDIKLNGAVVSAGVSKSY